MDYQFEVALSFAGENRDFAGVVAQSLRQEGVQVFYDNFYAADLWGTDLSIKLRDVYYGGSRYCIMILSESYLQKMWTMFERQQAIERLITQRGDAYILPVRLDGFSAEVPGLSNLIGYLSVRSNEPQKVVENFLHKIGKSSSRQPARLQPSAPRSYIPNLKKSYTDREKNTFLKASFDTMLSCLEQFASETKRHYTHFEYEVEHITSRKVLFTLYNDGEELTRFKLWFGGAFGEHAMCLYHGRHMDMDHDGSMHESLSIAEHEGELRLKPLGMPMVGDERDRPLSSQEAAEYVWRIVCQPFSRDR